MKQSHQRVFLLSSSYSGSTLLSLLVNTHPAIAGLGDTYPVQGFEYADEVCTCKRPLKDCPFWDHLIHSVQETDGNIKEFKDLYSYPLSQLPKARSFVGYINFLFFKSLPSIFIKKLFPVFINMDKKFVDTILKYDDSSIYFDGSKLLPRLEIIKKLYPNTKIIHLLKDPRAYIFSCTNKYKKQKNYKIELSKWIMYNRIAANYGRQYPEKYLRIYYHDLVRYPKASMAKIGDFLNVSSNGFKLTNIDFEQLHLVGNSVRMNFEGIENKEAQWKNAMPLDVQRYIEQNTKKYDWVGLS